MCRQKMECYATSSIHVVFCGIDSTWDAPTWRHFPCVLESEDMGYCGRVNEERESGLRGQGAGLYDLIYKLTNQGSIDCIIEFF